MVPIPSHPGVYLQEVPSGVHTIAGVSTSVTAFLGTAPQGPVNKAIRLSSFSDYERVFGGLADDSELGFAVRQFFVNGGMDAWVVRVDKSSSLEQGMETADGADAVYASFIGNRALRQGLYALEDVDLFNLLCLPAVTHRGVLADAVAYCEERRAFLIVDTSPTAVDPASMVAQATGSALPKSDHAAVYFPWIYVSDPLQNDQARLAPPCGTIAGLYARSDSKHGVWKAPAGTDASLVGVISLAVALTDDENGRLNPLGVNCLRTFPSYGTVCWGARTLRGADDFTSEYKYVPVRRLALYLEESLYRGTQWVVFESNDEPLWAQIRLNIDAFMNTLFRKGAFQGSSPPNAYVVKCDRETNTQDDINQGLVNILVGFAPLKPAEFVFLRIQQRFSPERAQRRAQARSALAGLARRLTPAASWDDLSLPEPQFAVLRQIAAHLRQRDSVHQDGTFATAPSAGPGLAMLFTGDSDTGKAMAAEAMAREAGLDLYRIDMAAVVSKHIGETEKNLRRLFKAAENSGAILLFDEADALFGTRSDVEDSHDRYANIEIDYLLQQIESYRGLAVLSINVKADLDNAFVRRFRFVVPFPSPDPDHPAHGQAARRK